jgi:hypothetical protein
MHYALVKYFMYTVHYTTTVEYVEWLKDCTAHNLQLATMDTIRKQYILAVV